MIRVSAENAVQQIAARLKSTSGRVFVQSASGEPLAFAKPFAAAPDLAAGLTFVGGWFPGANVTDWAGLSPTARAEGIFISADWRASFEAGRFTVLSDHYSAFGRRLETTPLDAALVQVSPPDADGLCSLGVSVDFAPIVLSRSMLRVAEINASMPVARGGPSVPLALFDMVVETERPLPTYDAGTLDTPFEAIARHIATVTPDRPTVQFGLGKAGVAALAGLEGRPGVNIHSGMVTDPLMAVLDAGGLERVVTGAALGSAALYDRCATDSRVTFAPVTVTHAADVLASIPRLTAVNSALEVDLFGQVNAEWLGGKQISGIGGLGDFLRGAARSPGGVPIIALNAGAKGGAISRIVPRLTSETVTIGRHDVGVVITEHGIADLRGLGLDARAQALIAVAEPAHRDALGNAWDAMRRAF